MAHVGRLLLLSVVIFFGPAAINLLVGWLLTLNAVFGQALRSWNMTSSRHVDALNDGAHWAITAELWDRVESLRKKANVPGVAFGVVRLRDSQVPETEFGTWGLKTEDGESATPDTLYSIGSCSKAFASASLGLLMDDFASGRNRTELPPSVKELTWDTKIASLLPSYEWGLQDPYATAKASLRDALSHMSGLGRHDLSAAPYDGAVDVIKRMRLLKSPYELREKFQYNNLMYALVAHIISTYSGQPFTDFVSERIFTPLNMTDSTYDAVRAEQSGKLSHAWALNGRRIPFWRFDVIGDLPDGPGGVISNALDMTKWVATFINGGVSPWTNTTVIPKSIVEETTTSTAVMVGRAPSPELSLQGYGMGWIRSTYRGHEIVTHNGGIMGFNTLLLYLPWAKVGIIGFASVDGGITVLDEAAYRIVDHVLRLPPLRRSAADAASKKHEEAQSAPPQAESPLTPGADERAPAGEGDAAAALLVPLEAFAGTYHNFGYGSVTLCAPTSTSEHCKDVLATFASIPSFRSAHAPPPAGGPQAPLSPAVSPPFETILRPGLYGHWPRWLSTHIALFPLSAASRLSQAANASAPPTHAFSVALPALYPHGFGHNTTPFASYLQGLDGSLGWEGPRAECTVGSLPWVQGCGLFEDRRSVGEGQSVEELAEAWFIKS
ncbi:beta-lactamase/transpeptidase-like protein [Obba rivulosa]|uniref:Beta-lactamase/transpeptidase-like protein n=1 Tax=Obba rivulosa TaxID=1052685 RepID=A0A8E2AXW0_9APHY|nr:beta-lactamase/transpeptidase-like protein [Obba rivulosa]